MSVTISGLDLVAPDEPWGLNDFDVDDWDDLGDVGCGCGLGAPPKGGKDAPTPPLASEFPWKAVVGAGIGGVVGVGLAYAVKRLFWK